MLFFYPWTAVIHRFDINYNVCWYAPVMGEFSTVGAQ